MTMIRITPPLADPSRSTTINGRTYRTNGIAFIDVPDFDAAILTANGWGRVCAVGSTAERPALADCLGPFPGQAFYDLTVGVTVIWDGGAWIDPATGLPA